MKRLILLFALLFTPTIAMANSYAVNYETSQISFSGEHAGQAFQGEFTDFETTINFDPDNLANSFITVLFQTASATTGNAMYDGTLPSADWFDVKNYPTATFASRSFRENADGTYTVEGALTLKETVRNIAFDFTLTGEDPVHAKAQFFMDRLAYNIGVKSDPQAEWVSKDIKITLHLEASPI